MNQLLIPVDFSSAAGTAISYASQIASSLGVQRLVLLYCLPISNNIGLHDARQDGYPPAIEDLLKDFYNEYARDPSIEVEFLVQSGSVIENVVSLSKGCELIIMSSSKVGTQIRGWMGSSSFYIASVAHCPVLILPPSVGFVNWESIWHIQQKDDESTIVAEKAKQLNIDLGKITTKSLRQETFSSLLWRLIVVYNKEPAEDVRQSILEACQQEKIDLLLLVSAEKSSFQRFLKDEVIQIIFQFEIPILILQRPTRE